MKEEKQEKIGQSLRSKLIKNGHKVRGEKVFFSLLRSIKKQENQRPINVLLDSIDNISPKVMVISKKVGGSRYQIPVPIKENKEYGIGVSWLLNSVQSMKKGDLKNNILNEVYLAKRKEGEVIKKKNALHKVAVTNIAFLKFIG